LKSVKKGAHPESPTGKGGSSFENKLLTKPAKKLDIHKEYWNVQAKNSQGKSRLLKFKKAVIPKGIKVGRK